MIFRLIKITKIPKTLDRFFSYIGIRFFIRIVLFHGDYFM